MRSLAIGASILIALASFGQPGTLDPSFNNNGVVQIAQGYQEQSFQGIKVLPDNRTIACGYAMVNDTIRAVLMRFMPNGLVDLSFGTQGLATVTFPTRTFAHDLDITSDGRILVVGSMGPNELAMSCFIARFTSDGMLDAAFGDQGIVLPTTGGTSSVGYGVSIDSEERPAICGYSTDGNGAKNGFVMRMAAGGVPDVDFSGDGLWVNTMDPLDDEFNDLAIGADGSITAVGYERLTSDPFLLAVRLHADGTPDLGFGLDGLASPLAFVALSSGLGVALDSGRTVISGWSGLQEQDYNATIFRLDSTGASDSTFAQIGYTTLDSAYYNQAEDVALQPDGRVVVCGRLGDPGTTVQYLARYLSDGELDPGFGNGGITMLNLQPGQSEAHALAIRPDGRIHVAGTHIDTQHHMTNARYLGDGCAIFPAVSPNGLVLCPNGTEELTTGMFDSYQWYKNGAPIPGATAQTLPVTAADDAGSWFKVETTIDTCSGMSDSVLVDGYAFLPPFIINAGDAPNLIGDNGEQIYCQGDDPVLVLGAPYDTNVQWSVNGEPIPGANDTLYAVPGSGSYTVEGAPAVCPDFIQNPGVAVVMDFHPYVQPTIYQTGILLCPQPEGLSSQWYYNGQPVAGFEQCVIPIDAGNYTVFVDYGDSCSVLSAPFYLVGLDEYARSDMKASPVPTPDRVIITWTEGGPLPGWRVIDVTGRIVRSGTKATSPLAIDLGALDVGRYRFLSGDGRSLPLAVTH